MRTLGIDLASQPETTAACRIEWGAGAGTVVGIEMGVEDPRALELIDGADAVGIDAPFGWPVPFVELVRNHHGLVAGTEPWTPARRDALRFRRTDHLVRERLRRWPLSVSSDLIAIVAMRCAGLLDYLGVVDRSGDGRVVEVYPAVALACWRFQSNGYKSAKNGAVLAALSAKLFRECPWLRFEGDLGDRCAKSDHAFDALIAALVSRAGAVGLTERPSAEDLDAARVEGWIAIPHPDSLAMLPTGGR